MIHLQKPVQPSNALEEELLQYYYWEAILSISLRNCGIGKVQVRDCGVVCAGSMRKFCELNSELIAERGFVIGDLALDLRLLFPFAQHVFAIAFQEIVDGLDADL